MACVCEDYDRECSQRGDRAGPFEDTDGSALGKSIASDVVRYNENHKVRDRE